ncbi:MAG: CoB--CoM heterodisulfide reductase iron-sulfur subunit B family protein [Thermoplasmata archaeon]|nr:MAG: CoB--CoM heterodisulfide reductase iron-sulfur subunit B family protein [Thermoplasmata archaeon]
MTDDSTKLKYTLYLGCNIATEAYGYEISAKKVLDAFDVELVLPDGYSCCGVTMRSVNSFAFLCLAARNMAISEALGNGLLVYCTGCRLSLSEAQHILAENSELKQKVNEVLAKEDLNYNGTIKIIHINEFLHDIIGEEKISGKIVRKFDGKKIVPHYGCHALRPSEINPQDDVENPQKLDDLIRLLGAEAPHHPEKLDCCGAPLLLKDVNSAYTMVGTKISALMKHEIDAVVTVCPSCQKMFENQKIASDTIGEKLSLPVLYFTQLLGLAMGMEPGELGIQLNLTDYRSILS